MFSTASPLGKDRIAELTHPHNRAKAINGSQAKLRFMSILLRLRAEQSSGRGFGQRRPSPFDRALAVDGDRSVGSPTRSKHCPDHRFEGFPKPYPIENGI